MNFEKVVSSMSEEIKLEHALKFIKENEVYVGISDQTSARENEENNEVTNADLLFIHTNGSPVNNIPPRPVLEPAIKNDKERLSNMMKSAFESSLNGDDNEALNKLKLAGMRGQNVCRAWFVNEENGWQPNAESTIRQKKRKHKSKDYTPRPLIDTGELRKSITYFVSTHRGKEK